ncbi:murein hydrolase activator EnvC family protein, partial [candidate division CSSED10-310 bacterium]
GKIKRYFGRQINPRFMTYTYCKGMLIAADSGTPVSVVADGVVRFADWFQGYGNLIIIQHDDQYYSLYGHLSEILVTVKNQVNASAIIGRVGDSGSDAGFVLYFELRRKGMALDPGKWLK